jgi:hypothetical protein
MNEVTIKKDMSADAGERGIECYDCPNCKENIMPEFNYCPDCGAKIKWDPC